VDCLCPPFFGERGAHSESRGSRAVVETVLGGAPCLHICYGAPLVLVEVSRGQCVKTGDVAIHVPFVSSLGWRDWKAWETSSDEMASPEPGSMRELAP
jgi:hypothetical protein